jgi:iron-sulfur cluster protein
VEELKRKLQKIKEFSIENLTELKEKLKENLEKQKVEVFEAKDSEEARKILEEIIPEGELVAKAKSNTINEIEFEKRFAKRNEIVETDCGDFIVQLCSEKGIHPVTPAIHITSEIIVETIKEKFGISLERKPEKIIGWVRNYLREKILKARFGLTGANALASEGAIFLLENEGNISLVSRLPENHIIVAGIDKIVPTLEDALTVCKVACLWGGAIKHVSYINIISSPSKTIDIEKKLIYGMHGAKNVYLILLDNGRSKAVEKGLKEALYCINCGACLYFCPVYRQIFDRYGLHYLGGIGIAKLFLMEGLQSAFERGLYFCTGCRACKEQCPVGIDVASLIRKIRKISVKSNIETDVNKRMIENIKSFGNPFGGETDETPTKLFCC